MTAMPFAFALSPWLYSHWFRLALVLLGLVLLALALWQRRRFALACWLGGPGAALALLGLGGILIPAPSGSFFSGIAGWLLLVSALGLIAMASLLFLMGFWYRPLAFVVPALGL